MSGLIKDRWPLKWALLFLGGTTLTTFLVGLLCISFYQDWRRERRSDPRYAITQILQTGPEREALPTNCLAELLSLSSDVTQNLYAFDLKKGEKALLECPLIVQAKLERSSPSTLAVNYEIRRPIALLADYQNVAVDAQGYLFPLHPFLSPKEMPEIYLGLPPFEAEEDAMRRKGGRWGEPLSNREWLLALEILQTFDETPWKEGISVRRIDLSNAFASTLGRREIVLFTSEEVRLQRDGSILTFLFPKILRLPTRDYRNQLNNFFSLRATMQQDYARQLATFQQGATFAPRIIDLRLSHLAFVENRPE